MHILQVFDQVRNTLKNTERFKYSGGGSHCKWLTEFSALSTASYIYSFLNFAQSSAFFHCQGEKDRGTGVSAQPGSLPLRHTAEQASRCVLASYSRGSTTTAPDHLLLFCHFFWLIFENCCTVDLYIIWYQITFKTYHWLLSCDAEMILSPLTY